MGHWGDLLAVRYHNRNHLKSLMVIILKQQISNVSISSFFSVQSTPRIVHSTSHQQTQSSGGQSHQPSHVNSNSHNLSHRQYRKNAISCVTVGDSDGESSPIRVHPSQGHQQIPQHQVHHQTSQHIKHEPTNHNIITYVNLFKNI